jgi:transcriptional regulator with XRE-family HTH domain
MVKKGTTKSSTKGNSERNPAVDESERLNRLLKPSTWSRQLEGEPLLPEDGLGARVKTKRTAMGLTHDGLSELTKIADGERRGISRTSVRGYELGTYKPGARELRILSLTLEVSPNWLLFGGDDDSWGNTAKPADQNLPSNHRWADAVMPLISYSQLAKAERKQVSDLVETLYRLQIGEVKFRSMRAFVQDFADTIQDAVRDARDHGDLNPNAMRAVLIDTAAAMREKHGPEEADLLMAVIEPLLGSLSSLKKPAKK